MKKSLIISALIILIPISVCAKYQYNVSSIKVLAQIAEPIIKVENIDETITTDFYKNTTKEYRFIIKNYDGQNQNLRISQIPFYYNLEIKLSNSNFPAKYELYNSNGDRITLDENLKTNNILINANEIYDEEYKLIVSWNEKDNLSSNVDTNILVDIFQYKEN